MTKLVPMLTAAAAAAFSHAATVYASEAPAARAWLILQQVSPAKEPNRANAAHALRLLVHNPRAQEMVERSLTDPDPKVRAAAARCARSDGSWIIRSQTEGTPK